MVGLHHTSLIVFYRFLFRQGGQKPLTRRSFSNCAHQIMSYPDSEETLWFKKHLLPHGEKLKAWLLSRFPDQTDVEDIVQESYRRTLTAHGKNPLRSPKAFLFTTARNYAINASMRASNRGEKTLVRFHESTVYDGNSDVFEEVAAKQEIDILEQAIQQLPDRCREIFNLRTVDGLTQQEIADRLSLSVNTVYAQLSIGFHKCAEYVETFKRRGKV